MLSMFSKNNKSIQSEEENIQKLAKLLSNETKDYLVQYQLEINNRLKEIQNQLKIIDRNIELLENKINIKESHDKTTYGHIHYKLEELNSLKKNLLAKKDD